MMSLSGGPPYVYILVLEFSRLKYLYGIIGLIFVFFFGTSITARYR